MSSAVTAQIYCSKVYLSLTTSLPLIRPKNLYLTHLSVEGDGSESKISEEQSCSLSIVTGAAEYHKGVSSQFI